MSAGMFFWETVHVPYVDFAKDAKPSKFRVCVTPCVFRTIFEVLRLTIND